MSSLSKIVFGISGAALLSGCAATGVSSSHTDSYVNPVKTNFQNSIVINESADKVWDRLVEKLSTSFFSINNIEKASRLINVSISSSNPEKYMDCGTTYRTDSFAGQDNSYTYKTASSTKFTYSEKHPQNAMLSVHHKVDRNTSMDGRVNIYLAPEGNNTKVSVNAIYVLDVKTSGTTQVYNAFGGVIAAQPFNNSYPGWANFTTSTPATEENSEGIACVSQGVLETQILDMAKP